MSTANYAKNYLRNAVEGASNGTILVMLFDGLVKFINLSIKHVDDKNIQEAHNYIIRSQDIVYELLSSLDREAGGEMADNLASLYDYVIRKLEKANIEKNTAHLSDVLDIIQPLRTTWREVVAQEEAKVGKPTPTTAATTNISGNKPITNTNEQSHTAKPTTPSSEAHKLTNTPSGYGAYARPKKQGNTKATETPDLRTNNTKGTASLDISG